MAEIPKIVLPHGGYKKLIVYRKSDVVYEDTDAFCRRFLPKFGGVRERMHAARTAARGEDFDKGLYSRLDASATPEALALAVADLKARIDHTAWGIRRRRDWS